MIQLAFVLVLIGLLFAVAFWRPWAGLVLLLATIPFNGFLLAVVATWLALDGNARTLAGAWHDGLALGVIAAAGVLVLRRRVVPERPVLALVGLVLVFGFASILVSPHLLTALYAYRTLYEPIALCGAIVILAREHGMSQRVAGQAGTAIVITGVITVLFAIWQVYVGGSGYLNLYYRTADGRLPAAYFSSMIAQPRAIGTFTSPNEFGAYAVLAIALVVVSGVLLASRRIRAWAFVGLAIGLLLTFSRSAWIGAAIAVGIGLVLSRGRLTDPRRWVASLDRAALARDLALPAIALVLGTGLILNSSGGMSFLAATVGGRDPSAASRVTTVANAIQGLIDPSAAPNATNPPSSGATPPGSGATGVLRPRVSLFGMGLGMAGPKSARFGQIGALDIVSSETWYVNYLLQVGIIGMLLLLALVLALGRRLWSARSRPWPIAAIAAGTGLAVGALAIPVVDEPSVAIPLWAIFGIALARAGGPGE